jgi:transcription elongation factor GreA
MTKKNPLYLTPEGKAKIEAELDILVNEKRPDLARRLRSAIQKGDLSENAEYIAAKEEQGFLEGKIQELQAILSRAEVVEDSGEEGVVSIGKKVVVAENGRDPETYMLVGAKEADPRNGKISNESPIGKALMGKRQGEVAVAKTPAGEIEFKIIEIQG